MGGLGREQQALLWTLAMLPDCMHILIEGMEGRMRQPSLIKMQAVDLAIEHRLNHFNVIDNPIIGALGNG